MRAVALIVLTVETLQTLAPLAASDTLSVGEMQEMAQGLDAMMAKRGFRGWLLRYRYRRMWGVAWRSLMLDGIDALDVAPVLDAARYSRSLTNTVR